MALWHISKRKICSTLEVIFFQTNEATDTSATGSIDSSDLAAL